MELRQLEYFLAVARTESFTAASQALFVSQPALSAAVRKLEHELGVELFERGPYGVMLTPQGRAVRDRAQQIVGMAQMLPVDARTSAAAPETVRLAIAPIAGAAAVLEILEHRSSLPEGLTVQLEEVPSERALAELARSARDVAVVVARGPMQLEHTPICTTPVMVAMSADHPLAQLERVEIPDLRGVPLMLLGQRSRLSALVVDQFAASGITPWVIHRTAQLTFMERMVQAGRAVSFLPASAALAHPALVLRPLHPAVTQEVLFAYRPGFAASERVQRLLDRITSTITSSSQSRGN